MTLLHQMAQVASMRRVTVILQILSARRVRQPIPKLLPLLTHSLRHSLCALDLQRRHLYPALQAVHRIHLTAHDLLDGEFGVVPRRDCAAELFHGVDGFGACAGYDDVNRCGELFFAASEELHAVFDAVDAAAVGELGEGDGLGWVEAAGVDPVLDAV